MPADTDDEEQSTASAAVAPSARAGVGPALAEQVGAKAARKLRVRRDPAPGVWFGLGMMGVIGWSVAVPTLLGAALGIWLDDHYAGRHSWTLALLIGGLTLGCANAWHWVAKEERALRRAAQDHDD
jgi:ATP synthase protein I